MNEQEVFEAAKELVPEAQSFSAIQWHETGDAFLQADTGTETLTLRVSVMGIHELPVAFVVKRK